MALLQLNHQRGCNCPSCIDLREATAADINKLDAVVHQLGIEDSFKEPAEEIAKLQERYHAACLMRDSLEAENRKLREKAANVHVLICSASARLAGMTADGKVDVNGAASDLALAVRLNA